LAKEQAEHDAKVKKESDEAREKRAVEKQQNIENINKQTGVTNDYDDIVSKANATGVDSLSDYQKMIYNSLERDEKGNIKRNADGSYKLAENKRDDVSKWLANKDNVNAMSDEDRLAARKQAEALAMQESSNLNADLANDVINDANAQIEYTDENGKTHNASSLKAIVARGKDTQSGRVEVPWMLEDKNWMNSLEQGIKDGNVDLVENRIKQLEKQRDGWLEASKEVQKLGREDYKDSWFGSYNPDTDAYFVEGYGKITATQAMNTSNAASQAISTLKGVLSKMSANKNKTDALNSTKDNINKTITDKEKSGKIADTESKEMMDALLKITDNESGNGMAGPPSSVEQSKLTAEEKAEQDKALQQHLRKTSETFANASHATANSITNIVHQNQDRSRGIYIYTPNHQGGVPQRRTAHTAI